jgi:hypothetical protein
MLNTYVLNTRLIPHTYDDTIFNIHDAIYADIPILNDTIYMVLYPQEQPVPNLLTLTQNNSQERLTY